MSQPLQHFAVADDIGVVPLSPGTRNRSASAGRSPSDHHDGLPQKMSAQAKTGRATTKTDTEEMSKQTSPLIMRRTSSSTPASEGGDSSRSDQGGRVMPRGDGTGPMGAGAMTGRAGGFCSGSVRPGFGNTYIGRGGFGYGRNWPDWRQGGLGRRGWWNTTLPAGAAGRFRIGGFNWPVQPDPEAERNLLKNQVAILQSELNRINGRLQALEAKKSA